ncbi:Ger(x)C family spore germination protein [Rossellomorea vietnamensis]|uniref:Ger(X)C family spore germination protein n=1 Tax=Rossellomorea vietnamensis TaxID=218284 RepID=A0A5D4NSF1_9BACI|nr:Ger(x)C family spore germination protein [Rossellomorea vietnamensis]TYS16574.1 Ger(x)C family spore germination protein [Rossellomorea vietnamensis]
MSNRWILKVLVVAIALMFLCGCWDNRDINHREMPVVLGISKHEEGYKVYFQIPEPQEETLTTKIVIGEGETINQVVDKISADMESSVDLLHVKVVLIDKNLAEEGMKDLIAGILRSRDISAKSLVAICEEDMNQLFAAMNSKTSPSGTSLLEFFEKDAGWSPQVALTRVWQIYRSIHSYTRDVAIPILDLGDTTLIKHVGSAVIKNGKMVNEITSDETLLYNAFNGESAQGKIEVFKAGSVLIADNSLSHINWLEGDTPFLETTIKFDVMLLETRGNPTTKEIKTELEEILTIRYQELFEKLQETEADILGIGQLFRVEIPRMDLEKWRSEYFPRMKADFQIEVVIENTGNLKAPSN